MGITDDDMIKASAHGNRVSVNIADLANPNDTLGRSYREINRAKRHQIPVGSLVELESGARLFVVQQNRDCDESLLYYLSEDPLDTNPVRNGFKNPNWIGGYPEECLVVVRLAASGDSDS